MKLKSIIQSFCLTLALVNSSALLADSQWAMYQANPAHTGYAPVSINANSILFRWKKQFGSLPLNPVTAADGKVFISQAGYFGVQHLYALTQDNKIIWNKTFNNIGSVNPPSYDSNKVYVQTVNNSMGTYLSAYDANTGRLIFKSPHGAQWEHYYAPTIYQGTVYIDGGSYGGMYSFDGTTGKQNWFAGLNQYDQWTPSIDDKWAYAYMGENTSGDHTAGLYVLDRLTGKNLFKIADNKFQWNGWSVDAVPVLGGMNDVFIIHDGRLIKFDTQNKKIAWQQSANYSNQPSVANGVIYAISSGQLVALDQTTGNQLWLWVAPNITENIQSNIIVTNSHAFVSTETNTYAIDLTTHKTAWKYLATGNLTLAQGILYTANKKGVLTAFNVGASYIDVKSALNFGSVVINTSSTQALTITNYSNNPVIINNINSASTIFSVDSSLFPLTINANQSVNVNVNFTPTATAVFYTDLTIQTNDTSRPQLTVHLQGTGLSQ